MFGGIPESEISQFKNFWTVFPSLKEEIFSTNGEHASVKVDNIKKTIEENADVKKFLADYRNAFEGFKDILKSTLIDNVGTVQINMEEDRISEDILGRFKDVKLVDKYEAFMKSLD